MTVNHTIDWEGVMFPTRDWLDCHRGEGSSRDQKDRSQHHEQEWGAPPTTLVVLQVGGDKVIAICHKWHSTSALMMPIVAVW